MVQPVSGYCATTTQRRGRIAGLHFHLEIRETVCESRSGAMIDGAQRLRSSALWVSASTAVPRGSIVVPFWDYLIEF